MKLLTTKICNIFPLMIFVSIFHWNTLFSSNTSFLNSSAISLEYKVNQRFISMGDVIQYEIIINSPEELLFYPPEILYNTAYPLANYDFGVDLGSDEKWNYTVEVYFTFFEIGSFTFAPITLSGIKQNSNENFKFQTKPLKIEVQGFDIEDFTKIKPYAEPIVFSFDYKLLFIYSITAIILLISIVWIAKKKLKSKYSNSTKTNNFVDYKDVIKKRLQILKIQQQEEQVDLEEFITEVDKLTKSFFTDSIQSSINDSVDKNILIISELKSKEKQAKDIYNLIKESNISVEYQKELSNFFRNLDLLKFSNTYLQSCQNDIANICDKAIYYIDNVVTIPQETKKV